MEKETNGDTEQLTGRTDRQGEYSAICLFEGKKIEGRDLQFSEELDVRLDCDGKNCSLSSFKFELCPLPSRGFVHKCSFLKLVSSVGQCKFQGALVY